LAALPHATWDYDQDADEMNVLLPSFEGREGRMVLIDDDFSVCFDAETAAPLSLMIPNYSSWLAQHLDGSSVSAAAPATPPRTLLDQLPGPGVRALRSAVGASRELAALK
jgi:hypothetical protein